MQGARGGNDGRGAPKGRHPIVKPMPARSQGESTDIPVCESRRLLCAFVGPQGA